MKMTVKNAELGTGMAGASLAGRLVLYALTTPLFPLFPIPFQIYYIIYISL